MKVDFANLIWNGVAQPKHRFIVWLATKDRLLTKERLTKLHIPVDDLQCCLCNSNDEETTKHLFDECAWFQTIREDMMQWTGIRLQHGSSKQVLLEIRRKHWKAIQKEIIAAVWGAMIYHTWRARNWKLFKGRTVHTNSVIKQIKKEMLQRLTIPYLYKKLQRCRDLMHTLHMY